MNFSIFHEIRRILLLLVASLLVSWYQHSLWPTAVALLLYLSFSTWQLARINNWLLQQPEDWDPPESSGAWGDLFDNLYRLLRREKAQREALAELIARTESSVSALRDGVVILDRWQRMTNWNQAAALLLGLRRATDLRQPITNLVRNPDLLSYLRAEAFERPLNLPSPHVPHVMLEISVTRFGAGEYLFLLRDITQLHQLEQMRKDFVANVSHELKTPLTVLKGYLEALQDLHGGEHKTLDQALSQMAQQSERMQALINDLLFLARLESAPKIPAPEPLALKPLLNKLWQEAQAIAPEKQHQFTLDIPDTLTLQGSPSELQSAFLNLLTNAVKYTPAQGHIQVSWEALNEGGLLTFSDNGPGIAKHHLPRLTERFYRPDAGREQHNGGTGLGLAIVKHVLIRHHAQLDIRSQPGAGSQFICHFPAPCIANT